MPYDKSGKPAHSFGRAKLNNELEAAQPSHASVSPKSRPAGHQPDPDSEMGEQSPEDIRDVVKEHGPANELHMKSDHAAGVHQVTTEHGGFKHHSKHGSAQEAHKHMSHALGMTAEHEDMESPAFEAKEEKGMAHSIPGMG